MSTRREFLYGVTALAALTAAPVWAAVPKARRRMKLLFLGGTGYIGPQQVEYALARGHEVTLFNRGKSARELYGDRAELLVGNRDAKIDPGLAALTGTRRWDAVIDNSGYLPRHVRDSAQLLKGRVGRYVYVSTTSIYDRTKAGDVDEAWPLSPLPDPENEEQTPQRYGPLKAECDRIVREVYGRAATCVRPTFVLGPGDDTYRFPYWLARIAAGGTVVGPRTDAAPLQWVDVRDLGAWVVTLAEKDVAGAFNAAGPPMEWDTVLAKSKVLASRAVEIRRPSGALVDDTKLRQPLVRADEPRVRLIGSLATRHGLTYRPMDDTVRATWDWWQQLPADQRAEAEKGWPTTEQERAVLERIAKG